MGGLQPFLTKFCCKAVLVLFNPSVLSSSPSSPSSFFQRISGSLSLLPTCYVLTFPKFSARSSIVQVVGELVHSHGGWLEYGVEVQTDHRSYCRLPMLLKFPIVIVDCKQTVRYCGVNSTVALRPFFRVIHK